MKIQGLTIKDIQRGLKEKKFSAVELAEKYLGKIKSEDKKIGAFLNISRDLALSQAKEVDDLISKGEEIPLIGGVPMAIKDNILIEGLKCTAGSKILENYKAVFDATCIKKLKKSKVLFLGKTNLDEFAMGSSTENSAFQKTFNPHDLNRVPGGSSGGSAAAVASDECCCALGSDTGGSIRQPASFCGVVGLKPTYGAVSRYGLIAFASSLDQIGPLAKNVEDCEIIFDVIKGKDPLDSTSVESKFPIPNFQLSKLRIGIPKEYFGKGISKEVKVEVEKVIKKIEKEGVKIEEVSLPHTKYAIACYYIIATSEASANLARYDGIKYGLKKIKSDNSVLLDDYLETRNEGFGSEVKRRIMLGTYSLSSGYYDAYYLKAQKAKDLIKKDFEEVFQKVDLIFTPVSPVLPFKMGEKVKDPLEMYLSDILTVSVNLAGLPALSLPCGEVDNLPVGLQIIGRPFRESEIFRAGKIVESLVR